MRKFGWSRIPPPLVPVIGFATVILVGTVGLVASETPTGDHIAFVDALFMATSAVCVTGLTLFDIGSQFNTVGQSIILSLIQVGGLGIMVVSTVFVLALGRRISFRSRFLVQDTYTHGPTADLHNLVRNVILFTLFFEVIGTVLLYTRFHQGMPPGKALYFAFFHAVSAFCNAGFSLFADSLTDYRADAVVILTMGGLIMVGGIGFLVLHEMVRCVGRGGPRRFRFSLHTKMVLSCTGMLLLGGTLFYLLSEWGNTLKNLPFSTKILAAFFQSVTTRTAGFNSIEISSMNNLSLMGTIMLMFIGASPGSTGGGIKTTTFGVLLVMSRARLAGMNQVHAFRRKIPDEAIRRAFTVFSMAVVIITLATAALLMFELGGVPFPASRGEFLELLFEVTSAFGTVGLSMGVTPDLTLSSKLVVTAVMFIGRLGPLVLAMAIQPKEQKGRFQYAEEPVMIG